MRFGFVISKAMALDATWTTPAWIQAAVTRGHEVRLIERTDFDVDPSGRLVARAWKVDGTFDDVAELLRQLRNRQLRRVFVDIGKLDVMVMRASPLTTDLLTFATMAENLGVRVVNTPAGMLQAGSKAWLASLPDVPTPPSLVTRSAGAATVFFHQHGSVVVKPARGSGGRSVSLVKKGDIRSFDQSFEAALRLGGFVVVQPYLPAAERGEKRLLWLDGTILGGYLRTRAPGEFRHNLKQGGTAEAVSVSEIERALLQPITPHLLRIGVRFAGLDLIGEHLVEVNAVNPGGTFHTDRLSGSHHANTVIERFERAAPDGAELEEEHGLSASTQ